MRLTTVAPTETKHTHVADPHSPEKRRRRSVLKEAAAANRATPSMSLAADAHEGLADDAIQTFASQRALQQAVHYVRKIKGAADADKSPAELILPDEMTKTIRGDRFLFADTEHDPEKPRIIVFMSDYGVGLLRDNPDWCVDGTFFAAPKYFRQLLTINVLKNESSLPAAYLLLQGHSEETYDRALSAVFDDERMRNIAPSSFISDFERGLINSMKKRFPDSTEVLCQFHQAKAQFTNVQKKGLIPLYSIPEAKELLRCFMALGYLPSNEVQSGFLEVCQALDALVPSKIPSRFKPQLNQFVKYVNETYVGRPVRNRIIRPRYHPSSWNYFRRTLDGLARTNNAIEAIVVIRPSRFVDDVRRPACERITSSLSWKTTPKKSLLDRLGYLRLVQAHLSVQAFARLMEQEDSVQQGPSASAAAQEGTESTADNLTPACSQSSTGSENVQLPESSQEMLEYIAE
ncbi:hypothetical protein AAVH_33268, partial [Aphelenchoides avenae]